MANKTPFSKLRASKVPYDLSFPASMPTLESCYSSNSVRMISNLRKFIQSRVSFLSEYSSALSPSFESDVYRELSTASSTLSTLLFNVSK